ncbi:PIG-L family deacetylase [Mycolicibacterium sp.]|uniref:PIG-L family deacetylase n=1 Tax=Mycolicibacterium sp. TaxID=2320850 RepID=UPI001A26E8FC|nr:PIG-L family deacetylase [Mycolicibacterium sp.]MBJ7337474.1 PIG-L family deacetylase [Mycolicibacterium sp.]
MTERQASLRRPVLMIVHAHPDDESSQTGGTLARYAAAGCRTVLVTCTDGARGDAVEGGAKPGEDGHDPHRVAAHRSTELDSAASVLGVHDVVKLGYPDSGMPESGEPDSFSARPSAPMVTQMVRLVRLYEPDVVITYPPNGLSGHPDHVRTHELVVAAHRNVAANGEGGGRIPRLYYIAMSLSRLRAVQAGVRAAFGDDAWVPPDELGTDDAEVTTVIDVAPFWGAKLGALAAHASQPDAALLLKVLEMADDASEPVARVEEYVRVHPPVRSGDFAIERDFFATDAP